jgi:alcohol dehydrogenase class IV
VLGAAADDSGIPHGKLLVAFAEAVLGNDLERLARARRGIAETLGLDALVDAAAVVANFNAIDRIADATGIPIDAERVELTADLRAQLGINAFAEGRL